MTCSWKICLGCLLALLVLDCRTSPPAGVQEPAGSGAPAAAGAEANGGIEPGGTTAAATGGSASEAPREPGPRAPLPTVAWGSSSAKYAACPHALCETRAGGAPPGSIRGCEPGAVEQTPAPLPAVEEASQDCYEERESRRGGGYPMVSSNRSTASGSFVAARVPLSRASAGPASPPSMPPGVIAPDAATVGEADELIVVAKDEDQGEGWSGEGEAGAGGDEERPTQGALQATKADGSEAGEFPLRHTEVAAEISGYIGKTVVEQFYTNPFAEVIEAVYVFPLPAMAAVNDFVMEVGGRKIVGLIRPREEAEQIYAEARARGQTASLLTQERPNIFTQSVANIEPGGEVVIRITYFERLVYQHGFYEFVFPMVVGPRYIPGDPQGAGPQASSGTPTPATRGGGGTVAPTDRVPDADRITPPVLRPGERSGHDIGLTVALDAGLPIRDLKTITHCVDVEDFSDTRKVVKLSAADSIPNRDFVLRWSVAGIETQFGVLAHRGELGGFFTLMMQPPLDPSDEQVAPREMTFLIDVSGSQSGLPLGISKEIVRRTLDELRPEDAFNIYYFASGNGQLWDEPRPRNERNVREAREFLDALCGGGGTEMLAGLRRAVTGHHDPKYLQMVVFLTDGYIGNEDEILRFVKEERGETRFFAFGIGGSVNRYLVDGIGEFGGGASHTVLPRDADHAGRAVVRLFELIDSPVLVDVKMDWNGLPIEDVFPARLPDLFAGGTIAVVGRYTGPARGTAYVEARVGERRLRLPVEVDLPDAESGNAALAPIWARWRIADMSNEMITADVPRQAALKQQITDLAVEFRLVSQFTAFVAVDESRVVGDGNPLRVMQPVELPEGVSYEGVFGERPVGETFEIAAWGITVQETETGKIRVGSVRLNSPAARAGIAAGAVVSTVDRTVVNGLEHLGGLVLQGGATVEVGFDPGGEVALPAP